MPWADSIRIIFFPTSSRVAPAIWKPVGSSLKKPVDRCHFGVDEPVRAEEIRMELDGDRIHFPEASSGYPVVAEIVGQVGAHESQIAVFQRRNLIPDPTHASSGKNQGEFQLRMEMPVATKVFTLDTFAGNDL